MKRHILKQLKYVQLIIMNIFSKHKLTRTPEPSALTDQQQHVEEYNKAIDTIMVLPYVLVLDMIVRLTGPKGFSFLDQRKAIDLCCGPGHFTRLLARYANYDQVTGVDLSEPMLEVAKANARKEKLGFNLNYIKSDVMNLESIPSGSLDIVSFMDGAHHMNSIDDVRKILTEATRVAKSTGVIILLDPVRPKNLATANLYENISGESYVELGLKHFAKDFHDSIHASWKTEELFEAIPNNSKRKWTQLVPFGFPAFQIIIGLPEGQEKLWTNKGLPKDIIDKLIPKKYKADWDMLKLSFKLAKKNSVAAVNPLLNWKAALKMAIPNNLSHDLIELALQKTPTGGNAKQFDHSWSNDELHIFHDAERAAHYMNPNHHASWIALGLLLASVETAAGSQGWSSESKISKNLDAIISFAPGLKENKPESLNVLFQRSTYRGVFNASPAPLISNTPGGAAKAHLAEAGALTLEFKKYIFITDAYLWLQKKATVSFFKEVRFFDDRIAPVGIRSKDLGVGFFDQIQLYFFSFAPWILSFIARIPLLNQSFKSASKRNLKNAHFILITAPSLDELALVDVGRAALTTWLNLEKQGYKVQPYSAASLPIVAAKTGHLNADTSKRFVNLFTSEGPAILQQQFDLPRDEKPVWLLRAGRES